MLLPKAPVLLSMPPVLFSTPPMLISATPMLLPMDPVFLSTAPLRSLASLLQPFPLRFPAHCSALVPAAAMTQLCSSKDKDKDSKDSKDSKDKDSKDSKDSKDKQQGQGPGHICAAARTQLLLTRPPRSHAQHQKGLKRAFSQALSPKVLAPISTRQHLHLPLLPHPHLPLLPHPRQLPHPRLLPHPHLPLRPHPHLPLRPHPHLPLLLPRQQQQQQQHPSNTIST